jgi:DNA-binding transcriptional LysR family regulator
VQTIWIEAFLAVVDHHGFAPAAAHLYRSQGRVSDYIAGLETELGVQLFDRRQRPARLTPEGVAFVPHARAMLETLENGRSAALAVQGLDHGDIALATYTSASAEYVPLVLKQFAADYPKIHVKLVERPIRGLDQALDSGEAPVIIRPTVPQLICRTAYEYRPLWREPVCLVVSEQHNFAGRERISASDLADEPLIMGGLNNRDAELARLLSSAGVIPRIKYLSEQPQAVVALARHGLASGVINVLALRSIKLEGVVVIPLDGGIGREVGVYWSHAAASSAAVTALLGTILSTPPPPPATDARRSQKLPPGPH